jgi:hypothetical protein
LFKWNHGEAQAQNKKKMIIKEMVKDRKPYKSRRVGTFVSSILIAKNIQATKKS